MIIAVPRMTAWRSRLLTEEGRTSVPAPLTPAAATARLTRLSSSIGPGGSDAYRALLAAGLTGDASRFTSPEEVRALWRLWTPLARLGDATAASGGAVHWGDGATQAAYEGARAAAIADAVAAAAAGMEAAQSDDTAAAAARKRASKAFARYANMSLVLHAPGDASWLRGLPRPTEPVVSASTATAAAGSLEEASHSCLPPSVAGLHIEAVVAGSCAGDPTAQFAADLLGVAWAAVRGDDEDVSSDVMPPAAARRRLFHWATDAGSALGPVLGRVASMDTSLLLPLSAVHVHQAGERDARPGAPGCHVCCLVPLLLKPLAFEEAAVHVLLHPNVSHVNGLAAVLLEGRGRAGGEEGGGGADDGVVSFDLITLRVGSAEERVAATSSPRDSSAPLPLGLQYSLPQPHGAGKPMKRPAGMKKAQWEEACGTSSNNQSTARVPTASSSTAAKGGARTLRPGIPPVFVSSGVGLAEAAAEEADTLAHVSKAEAAGMVEAAEAAGAALLVDALVGPTAGAAEDVKLTKAGKQSTTNAVAAAAAAAAVHGRHLPRRPLMPYRGEVDIRLSDWATAHARHVWVMVPESRLLRGGSGVGAGGEVGSAAAASISSDGTIIEAPAPGTNASSPLGSGSAVESTTIGASCGTGAQFCECGGGGLPLDVLEDIAALLPTRTRPVRVYVARGM